MTCEKWRRRLSDDLDGALPASRRRALDRHLELCARCREYREDIAPLRAGPLSLPGTERPPEFWAALERRILEKAVLPPAGGEVAPAPPPRRWNWAWAGAGLAAVAALAIGLRLLLTRTSGEAPWMSGEEALARVFEDIGSSPELEDSFNSQIASSIAELARDPEDEVSVPLVDSTLFWESMSDEELALVASELEKKQGHGGPP